MSLKSEQPEIEDVLTRLLDNLALTISSQTGRLGADLRRQIGRVRADYSDMMTDGTFSSELLACFTAAREADVKLTALAYVRQQLFAEDPIGEITTAMVLSAIAFCLAAEARMVAAITFTSRDDVEIMMKLMKAAFDTAREKAADAINSSVYQQLTYLAGALTNHLATTARPLPRMVTFAMPKSLPALTMSNRIYYSAERYEELMAENKTVNPVFMQRELRGLSN